MGVLPVQIGPDQDLRQRRGMLDRKCPSLKYRLCGSTQLGSLYDSQVTLTRCDV